LTDNHDSDDSFNTYFEPEFFTSFLLLTFLTCKLLLTICGVANVLRRFLLIFLGYALKFGSDFPLMEIRSKEFSSRIAQPRCATQKKKTMPSKPVIKSTKALPAAASRELVRNVAAVRLTPARRDELRQYATKVAQAFSAPLPHGVRRCK